ncbi:MAG: 23S rRNA (pseudouridine(1915)-N(3))-methyltransferase RlmH [Candidatus Zixiibacteriota bacterium]
MLKIRILAVGKDKDAWVTKGCEHYLKLLSKYADMQLVVIPNVKSSASLFPNEIRSREAEKFEKHRGKGLSIALADSGKCMNSPAFARQLDRWHAASGGRIDFLIGGPYGLDARVTGRADACVSLSPMTFSHQLVRLVLLEQLYRAFSILGGTPYHK